MNYRNMERENDTRRHIRGRKKGVGKALRKTEGKGERRAINSLLDSAENKPILTFFMFYYSLGSRVITLSPKGQIGWSPFTGTSLCVFIYSSWKDVAPTKSPLLWPPSPFPIWQKENILQVTEWLTNHNIPSHLKQTQADDPENDLTVSIWPRPSSHAQAFVFPVLPETHSGRAVHWKYRL